jgi:hypothetical protein
MKKRLLLATLLLLGLPLLFSNVQSDRQISGPIISIVFAQGDPPPSCPDPPCPGFPDAKLMGASDKPANAKTAELGAAILFFSAFGLLAWRSRK